jgi:hypothetical protein
MGGATRRPMCRRARSAVLPERLDLGHLAFRVGVRRTQRHPVLAGQLISSRHRLACPSNVAGFRAHGGGLLRRHLAGLATCAAAKLSFWLLGRTPQRNPQPIGGFVPNGPRSVRGARAITDSVRYCLVESSPPSDPEPMGSAPSAGRDRRRRHLTRPERRRLILSLLLSLLIHALLLSLNFGGQELGLPGFEFPWEVRRVEVPELRVVLVPPQVTAPALAATSVADPLQPAPINPPVAVEPVNRPLAPSMQPLRPTAEAIAPKAAPAPEAKPRRDFAIGM